MSRWFALLGLMLLAGCGGDPSTGAHAYRTSPLPPTASAQVAAAPQPATPAAAARQPAASAAPVQLSALSPDGSSFVTADPSSSADTAPAADAAPAPDHPASSRPMQLAAQASAPAATAAPAKTPKPAPYEKSVAAYLKRYALDPASLQQAKIGKPFPGTVNGRSGSIVCVELKSAQGSGAFRTAYLLQKDTVVDSQYGAPACQGQQLEPWSVAD